MSAAVDTLQVSFREMQPSDVAAVLKIERASYSFPWSEMNFRDCIMFGYTLHVVEYGGRIIAYSVCQNVAPEAHILNLCVYPSMRRRSFASSLLVFIQQHALSRGVERMYLEVRPSNQEAVALYLKHGFVRIGVRPAYYPGVNGREDASVMSKWLGRRSDGA